MVFLSPKATLHHIVFLSVFTWQEGASCQQILHIGSDCSEQTWSACSHSSILSSCVLDFVIQDIWHRGHAGKDKNKEQH